MGGLRARVQLDRARGCLVFLLARCVIAAVVPPPTYLTNYAGDQTAS